MTSHLDYQTPKLKRSILELVTLVEDSVQKAITAFQQKNLELAKKVVEGDKQIDAMEIDFEEECLKVMALYQPVAIDLRMMVSMIKINDALERIGDLSKEISKRVIALCDLPEPGAYFDFQSLFGSINWMLKNGMDSMINLNSDQARKVCIKENEVDEAYGKIVQEILQKIESEPKHVQSYIHLLAVADMMEQMGDELKKIEHSNEKIFLLVMPEIHIDTKTTFKKFKIFLDNNQEKVNFADYIIKGNFLFKFFENDFETIIVPAYPEIGQIKKELLNYGAIFSSLSGTGSTVYGVFDDEAKAISAESIFKVHYKTCIAHPVKVV